MNNDPSAHADGTGWLTAIASLVVGAAFFALWFWLLPGWLGFDIAAARAARWRWIGAVPSILGFSVALRCIWDFGRTGRGTPAPFVPPQRLVVVGFYRYVRNPMYVGFFGGWMGLWIVFGRANRAALMVVLIATAAVVLFVRFYEEPTLRKMFGADYEKYCLYVPRWIPRLHAWTRGNIRNLGRPNSIAVSSGFSHWPGNRKPRKNGTRNQVDARRCLR